MQIDLGKIRRENRARATETIANACQVLSAVEDSSPVFGRFLGENEDTKRVVDLRVAMLKVIDSELGVLNPQQRSGT